MTYKTVQCVNEGCELKGVFYGIPHAMLIHEDEEVSCGGCGTVTTVVEEEVEIVNADHVAEVEALGRRSFGGS